MWKTEKEKRSTNNEPNPIPMMAPVPQEMGEPLRSWEDPDIDAAIAGSKGGSRE